MLRFCTWYHDYFAGIAAPVMSLLKTPRGKGRKRSKIKVQWAEESIAAFEDLKKEVLKNFKPVVLDIDEPFILRTDRTNASDYAVGATLEQLGADGGLT